MSGRKLTRLVVLDGQVWAAGSEPPPEIAARIRNPRAWSDEPEPAQVQPEPVIKPVVGRTEVPVADPATGGVQNPPAEATGNSSAVPEGAVVETGGITPGQGLPEPPRAGKGSGVDAWRAYAEQHGVTVDDNAERGEIIAALQDAGVVNR